MNRDQKKNKLVTAAGRLASELEGGGEAFFGNQGVSIYATKNRPGDIIGTLLLNAGILPPVACDITDPKEAVAIALAVRVDDLPVNLQSAINELAIAADDTKRSYSRRVPKLVKLLGAFVVALYETKFGSTAVAAPVQRTQGFVLPGRAI